MLKKMIIGSGFLLLTTFPLTAQTSARELEKSHPLEAPTSDNPAYRKRTATKDYTGISKDPQYKRTGASTTNTSSTSRPPATDSTAQPPVTPAAAPVEKKDAEKPKQN